ncbi:SAM-dependent methyltransferase [Catenulispora pinisilvae]|uniref:SAM-dependent methyltransferase n=1 Tax=Catenulispora pinisilvae TaxID=2705253 RepID=UPI00189256F2|nr:SAM-dependent methyltransferase [Catenulispora pinisilvae]
MAEDPTQTPNVARMYDYFLGGTHHTPVDRAAADAVIAANPDQRRLVRANRDYLGRVVRELATGYGIRQFVDIGSGLPTADPVHEVAARVAPDVRVVYVDDDPAVVAESRALLADGGDPRVTAIAGNLLDPESVLGDPDLAAVLDPEQPIAVLMLAVLHFFSDRDDPFGAVAAYRDLLAPGSCLALSYLGTGDDPEWEDKVDATEDVYQRTSQQYFPRTRIQVLRFFEGFELLEPGLSTVAEWRPDSAPDSDLARIATYGFAGVGRKPAP